MECIKSYILGHLLKHYPRVPKLPLTGYAGLTVRIPAAQWVIGQVPGPPDIALRLLPPSPVHRVVLLPSTLPLAKV